MTYELWLGDCLQEMDKIEAGSVDCIICDLPYGERTACKWDELIPFEPLWKQYKRIIKKQGVIALTATQPFTSMLVLSNLAWFKYEWVWKKSKPNGWQQAKNKPMQATESIIVFSPSSMGHVSLLGNNRMKYNPQGVKPLKVKKVTPVAHGKMMGARPNQVGKEYLAYTGFPTNILDYPNVIGSAALHPTQKPVPLLEYLIKTYTNPGELVLDNTMGSGSTGEACLLTDRRFIGIEKDAGYYQIAVDRLERVTKRLTNQDLPMFAEVAG